MGDSEHDPRQLGRSAPFRTASKPGVKIGTICGAKMATIDRQRDERESIMLSTVETTRHARSSSSRVKSPASTGIIAERQGAGRDELEDRVGQPERGEVGVELGAGAEQVGDDHDAHPAQDARHEERRRRLSAGARQVCEPAVTVDGRTRRLRWERGWAAR